MEKEQSLLRGSSICLLPSFWKVLEDPTGPGGSFCILFRLLASWPFLLLSFKDVSSTRAVPAEKSSEYLASQSSIELNNSSATKNNTLINLKKLSDSQSFHASSTTAKYDKEYITGLEEGRIVRNNKYAARGAGSDIMFDDSDGLDSDEEENIKINGTHSNSNNSNNNGSLPPPNRPAPMVPCKIVNESESRRTSTSSSVGARVHPKLPPDYDSLAAHFDSLKSNRSYSNVRRIR